MTTELIPVTDQKAIEEIFLSDGLQSKIEEIKKDAENYVADVSTKKGRDACKSKAAGIAKQKVVIDNAGKDLKSDYKKKCDDIDSVRKWARDTLDETKIAVRKPVTDWEMEEERRIEAERQQAEFELDYDEAVNENELFDRQKEVERKEAELQRQEDERKYKEEQERQLREQAEREARIAQEAKEKAECEAQEAIEAEKRAKIEAELKAKQDAERAEQEKKEALERAEREKQEAIESAKREEIERQLKIKQEAEEKARVEKDKAEKKAANVAHQKKINREALNCFMKEGIKEGQAREIITMIAHKKIKNITVNY